ncbi:hypothetical protein AW736_03175 [Termitidicoccus mucosus]|uniref:Thioredoxin domain-containing protein n=1 Tax=Termitidicoccus mucosus TaxID=1184151 RepID=A0A178IP42_9BACT|nr:hypothetical protein AW736_03175 [Opitutaceae bacterium TSB47]
MALFVCAWCAPDVFAQWYAPETNYHDPVQRVFPVELARVLAWRENAAHGAGIAEVTYDLDCAEDGAAEWTLRWLGENGGVWREVKVSYRAALLLGGPDFYRNIARQLRAQPWAAFERTSETDLETAFWEGLWQMQASRMATLREAMSDGALKKNHRDAGAAARLAGELLASTVPSVGGMLTLDSTLAARGAAWLALAEEAAEGGEMSLAGDLRWAVVLKLAQREEQALRMELNVRAGRRPGDDIAQSLPGEARGAREWWQFVLGPNERRETLLQAARHESPAKGAALLGHAVRLGEHPFALTQAAELLYGRDNAQLPQLLDLHDLIGLTAGPQVQHWVLLLWADAARADWLRTMRQLSDAERGRISGLDEAIKEALLPPKLDGAMIMERVRNAFEATKSGFDARHMLDQVSPGFRKSAPLIRLGYREGEGRLEPVAVVSTRDLLCFGWEMCGVQSRMRWRMIPFPQAKTVLRDQMLEHAPELGPFFQTERWSREIPEVANLDRLQRIEHMAETLLFAPAGRVFGVPESPDKTFNVERTRRMGRRGWLMPMHMKWVALAHTETIGDNAIAPEFFERIHAEGGMVMDRVLLLALLGRPAAKAILGDKFQEIVRMLSASMAEGDPVLEASRLAELRERPDAEFLKMQECVFWMAPDMAMARNFFGVCLEINAFQPMRRFFEEARPMLDDDPQFYELVMGVAALALVENDLDGVRRYLPLLGRENAKHRAMLAFLLAVADQNMEDAKQAAAEIVAAGMTEAKNIDGYVALWAALRNRHSPDYRNAFDHLSKVQGWPIFQWIVARQAGMDTEELIKFLGGDQAREANQMLVHCLRKQKGPYRRALRAGMIRMDPLSLVLVQHVASRQFGQPEVTNADLPSLRPEKPPLPLRKALLAEREKGIEQRFARECAAFRTAGEWWAFYQEWKTRNRIGPGREGDTSVDLLERQAVLLRLFSKQHPGDARVWDARLALARSGKPHQPSDGGDGAEPDGGSEQALASLAGEPDTPSPIRAAAMRELLALRYPSDAAPTLEAIFAHQKWLSEFHGKKGEAVVVDRLFGMLAHMPKEAAVNIARELVDYPGTMAGARARAWLEGQTLFARPLDFSFTAVDGRAVDVSQMRGAVILIVFANTWARNCIDAIPSLRGLEAAYGEPGPKAPPVFRVIGVTFARDDDAAKAFAASHGFRWPQYSEKGMPKIHSWMGHLPAVPGYWLVDKHGIPRKLPLDANLETEIKNLLAEPLSASASP